jgi:endonuclease-3
MRQAEKAARIGTILDRLYPGADAPLEGDTPFTLLVAVMLSAQCTDATVNRVAPVLFHLAATPQAMAVLPVRRIEAAIHPCGLAPTKARYILKTARLLCSRFNGVVPESFEELERLPGVGHKTASVVMAQAFRRPAFPVDTHIQRCAYRWGLADGTSVAQTEARLKMLFPPERWHRTHLQIIFYGREYCPARGHRLERCVICRRYGIRRRLLPRL